MIERRADSIVGLGSIVRIRGSTPFVRSRGKIVFVLVVGLLKVIIDVTKIKQRVIPSREYRERKIIYHRLIMIKKNGGKRRKFKVSFPVV